MSPPSTIARYKISAKLGAGGMGAVCRATDTEPDREVAIKIIPDALAQDADRLARFEREAQVLGGLNRPNIAAIYGVELLCGPVGLMIGPMLSNPHYEVREKCRS